MSESKYNFDTMSDRIKRKYYYRERLVSYLNEYKGALLIEVDFVGSNQMQQVRQALRGKAVVLMGKNTVIRRVFAEQQENFPFLSELLPHIKGNMGFVFTNEDLNEVKKIVTEFKKPAGAKEGVIAPSNVVIPNGPTPLDPGQTSFFQALNIATKISRGAIEILAPVNLIAAGEMVSPGAVALLNKLGIKPFMFGINVTNVLDNGSIYSAAVLDMTEEDMIARFVNAANKIAAISLETGVPNLCSMPHSIKYAFKKLVAIAFETGVMFPEAQKIKDGN
jgi:large subunit ribosomal protein LP0